MTGDLIERLRAATMRFDWRDLPNDAMIPAVPLLREAATALAQEREAREKAEKELGIKAELLTEEFRESARRADKIMALKRELDEARGWAKDWRQIVEVTCTVLDLGMLDPPEVVEAIRSKFEALRASLAEATRLLKAALHHAETEGDDTLVTVVRRFLAQEAER